MSLSRPPATYSEDEAVRFRTELDRELDKARKKNADVEIAGAERLIMSSPNGSRWSVIVDNAGALSAVAL